MKLEITSCVISAHNIMKLNVKNKRISITQVNWEINQHNVKWEMGYWKKSENRPLNEDENTLSDLLKNSESSSNRVQTCKPTSLKPDPQLQ